MKLPYIAMWIDSHCHLSGLSLHERCLWVRQAEEANVTSLLTIGTQLDDIASVLESCEFFPRVYGAIGVHPCYGTTDSLKCLSDLDRAAFHPKIVAIGEIGLDFKHQEDHATLKMQKDLFRSQLSLAQRLDKPIIIHSRQAEEATLSILEEFPGIKGVFHCFTGSLNMARHALDKGFYISFSGVITFKKIMELHDVVRFVPWDRLLIETDSPFLAPAPYRGKPNQPAYVRYVADCVCALKNITDPTHAACMMKDNFCRLFQPSGFR